MPIVTAHIKFSIGTTFLDNFFTAEDERLPGESIEDGVLRVRKHLVKAVDTLKKEAESIRGQIIEETFQGAKRDFPPIGPATPQVIDYKQKESLEISIDNASTLEDLAKLKQEAGANGLVSQYMSRLNQLMTNGK